MYRFDEQWQNYGVGLMDSMNSGKIMVSVWQNYGVSVMDSVNNGRIMVSV